MIIEVRTCHKCQSKNIVRNRKNVCGQQRYKCKYCGVTRVLDSAHKGRRLDIEQISQTYQERNVFLSCIAVSGDIGH